MKWQGSVLLSTYVYLILQGNAAPLECNYADIVRNHLRLQTGQGSKPATRDFGMHSKTLSFVVGHERSQHESKLSSAPNADYKS